MSLFRGPKLTSNAMQAFSSVLHSLVFYFLHSAWSSSMVGILGSSLGTSITGTGFGGAGSSISTQSRPLACPPETPAPFLPPPD